MFCKNCGNDMGDDRFCSSCGSATDVVGTAEQQTVYQENTYQNTQTQTAYAPNNGYAQNGGYSQGYAPNYNYAPVENFNLITGYTSMFKKYAQFNGRSRRSEYWFAYLMNYIVCFVLAFIMYIPLIKDIIAYGEPTAASLGTIGVFAILLTLYGFAYIIPGLAIVVRRLHDTGKSGWYALFSLIPWIGSIILIIFLAMDSQPGPNQYGPNPKGM